MSSDTLICVQNLSKCYHIYDRPQDRLKQSLWRGRKTFFREFWALKDVSFEVGKGEAVGIIGCNGSGKSTLLQMIAGTLTPTSGETHARGRVAALLELGSGFNQDFTGRENVYMNGAILGLSREELDSRLDAIIKFADIGEFIDQPVKTYSSGMLVRLAFSVSINVEPDILIVDEALAVGDMGFTLKCMERLEQLTKSGITMLFVSHDMGAIKAFCSRAIYLVEGRTKACGDASEMVELYLMDIRDNQRRAMGGGPSVVAKRSLGLGGSTAFGTEQGRIASAVFEQNGTSQWVCATGDTINIVVTSEYHESVENPSISLILHDRRMIDIAGRYVKINGKPTGDGLFRTSIRFVMKVSLNSGIYFFTLRLEDRKSDKIFFPIERQAGVLQLHVARPTNQHFFGIFDTPITYEEF